MNLLFFGELNGHNQVVFRGGRKQALKAGLQMRNGRGRFALMFGKYPYMTNTSVVVHATLSHKMSLKRCEWRWAD